MNPAPSLTDERWVFCTVARMPAHLPVAPLMTFREAEGLTLVLPKAAAESLGLQSSATFRQITLTVQSSLEAVGLTAAVSSALARAGIACNIVAAYHHDHLFVPEASAHKALEVLQSISAGIDLK